MIVVFGVFCSAIHPTLATLAQTASVLILTHNQPSTYLIPATEYEALLERLEDYELGLLAKPTFSNEMNSGFRTSTHPTLAKGF